MSSNGDADTDEQLVHALVGIGAELTRIRQLLEREQGAPADAETWTCRSCDATFSSSAAAEQHARQDHGAPAGHETDLIE